MRTFTTYQELTAALDKPCDKDGAFRFMPSYGEAQFLCADCLKYFPLNTSGMGGTGYGVTPDYKFRCYDCCGKEDERQLEDTGKATLYLTKDKETGWTVTNWPGTLKIKLHGAPKRGHHNLAGNRYDVWFWWRGRQFHGVQYGDNTQILHVKRTKAAA